MAVLAVALTIILSITYNKLSSIYDSSADVLRVWREGKAQNRRFLRSTPPVRVFIGSYFYVDKRLVLTIREIIVTNSVSLLVSPRK